ncbi:predicted nucleic acid-binding protein [Aeropyrum pernix]|uniref:Ribonuclease VapC n=1 Tax=Aeropyrum pernix TaxID=56636 RepID=A0A401HC11_AERPX|nr:predicted nucleic acid-binding protein [Aeropyrum pernix]
MIYIDSNAIIYLLHDIKPKSDLVIKYMAEHDEIFTSLRTIEEVSYILVRVKASQQYGARGVHDVRRVIDKHGLNFVLNDLIALRKLVNENNILVLNDTATIDEIHETMTSYKLLPGDAIIALTCKHYGISTILTFDSDFKRVPWLKVIP